VIDRAAPLARVRPYLEIAVAHGVDDLIIATHLPDVQSTRTLGEVRVDKLCALATLRIDENLAALDGPGTWEHAVAAYLGE